MCQNKTGTLLLEWKNDVNYSYWFPEDDSFPNIIKVIDNDTDNIVYLQITVSTKHEYSYAETEKLNNILVKENDPQPIFVFLCPDKEACQKLTLTNNTSNVDDAHHVRLCSMCVGYFEDKICEFSQHRPIPVFRK
jgi:hypothetical protein